MSYIYDGQTGEKYMNRSGFETNEGWCPYYNFEGKYVGARYGYDYAGNPDYYKPSTWGIVKNYEDLDW